MQKAKKCLWEISNKEIKLILLDIGIAIESIMAHKVKSFLTALGIVFGVAAVIAMLAIGNGAQQEILEQMKMVGVNNIIVIPKTAEQDKNNDKNIQTRDNSPGLTLKDVNSIKEVIPNLSNVCAQTTVETYAMANGRQVHVKLTGTDHSYFNMFGVEKAEGNFFGQQHQKKIASVCVISQTLGKKLFKGHSPIGQQIKSRNEWFTIVGTYKTIPTQPELETLGVETSSSVLYVPIETMLLRVINRGSLTQEQIRRVSGGNTYESTKAEEIQQNINQLDKIVVSITDSRYLDNIRNLLDRLLYRRHNKVADYEIVVPELLLKQQQRTRDIFNLVLGSIAGISLLVGGIGIMNIMLAGVMERVKEIGIRMAVGARKRDIKIQFIAEASLISLFGGFAGIVLGIVGASLVTKLADIKTVVTMSSLVVSFVISVGVGIIFGYLPAKHASGKDPIVSLRNE